MTNEKTKTCLICGKSEFYPIYSNTLLKCKSCSFITANLEITQEEIKKVYTDTYFKGEEYLDYTKEKESIQNNFKKRINFLRKKNIIKPGNKVLEIGCAYGYLAEVLNSIEGINYTGTDIAREACDHAKKHNPRAKIYRGDFLKLPSSGKYNNVFMFDVIEHLRSPSEYLDKIYKEMKDCGYIIITTGDVDSMVARLQKNKWRLIHPPTHLHYFSKKTLSLLLNKKGYKVKFVKYIPIARSAKQIFYSLFMLNKKYSQFINFTYKIIPHSLSISINTFDIMFIVAQKNKSK
jgi:2-polyprenyl-3-methyl-5-hydroxy-6-metoxy-1,4-benzoquinol methylase